MEVHTIGELYRGTKSSHNSKKDFKSFVLSRSTEKKYSNLTGETQKV